MSTALLTYLHAQPKAAPFSYFDIGQKAYYSTEEQELNWQSFQKSQIEPLLNFLDRATTNKVNVSLTIPVLEHILTDNKTRQRFETLVKTGKIEILAGQGFNSLSILFSRALFRKEIDQQLMLINELSGKKPSGFINTAMLYSDQYGEVIKELGFGYAVVPRISWFVKDKSTTLFRARSEDLKLFTVENTVSAGELTPANVLRFEMLDKASVKDIKDFVLFSEINSDHDLSVYSIPDLVAADAASAGIETIVGNNLQKDLLARLVGLSPAVLASESQPLMADFLWLGSLDHFKALSNKADDRHRVYAKLLTMLYDLEIRLR